MSFFSDLYSLYEDDGLTVYGPKKGPFEWVRAGGEPKLSVKEDIYFRLCPVLEPPEKGKRGKQDKSCALVFVWLDIDCLPHESNGKHYFPNKEEAIKWIQNYIPYSFIVDSGNGLHVYCILSSPIEIKNEDDFALAYEMSHRFQQWAREMCPFDIDSTHDLARVLRVPGSIHTGTGTQVEVLHSTGHTIGVDLISQLPISKRLSAPCSTPSREDLGFRLDANCKLDTNMLLQLSIVNPLFAETWQGKRGPSDPSASGWRFSMISFLMHAGLDKQDVVDITIRFLIDQRKYKPDQISLNRPELWAAEMLKCKVEKMSFDDIEKVIETAPHNEQISSIAALMEFPDPKRLVGVSRFSLLSGDNDLKGMVLQLHISSMDGSVYKVDLQNPMSRADSRKTIFNLSGIVLPNYFGKQAAQTNQKWEKAVQLAWHVADVYDPVESNSADMLMTSIRAFINSGDMARDLEESRETGRPCKDGMTYVVPTGPLNSYARVEFQELRSNREMHAAVRELRKVGVTKKQQMHKGVRMACLVIPSHLIDAPGIPA